MAQSKAQFGYRRHADQDRIDGDLAHYPVVVVGADPVGLSLAIDLARSVARASCCSTTPTESARARALSAFRNARWSSGTGSVSVSAWSTRAWSGASARFFTVHRSSINSTCYRKRVTSGPPSSTFRQFYAEAYLVDRVGELPGIDLRWRNKVIGLEQRNDHAMLTVETPDGPYEFGRLTSSPATAPAPRCGKWWARNSQGRYSRTSS